MSELSKEIAAYERMRNKLETDHLGKWVLVHDEVLVGLFATLEEAAAEAVQKFGRGPYLIREIGAAPMRLPASVLYRPVRHAIG